MGVGTDGGGVVLQAVGAITITVFRRDEGWTARGQGGDVGQLTSRWRGGWAARAGRSGRTARAGRAPDAGLRTALQVRR